MRTKTCREQRKMEQCNAAFYNSQMPHSLRKPLPFLKPEPAELIVQA